MLKALLTQWRFSVEKVFKNIYVYISQLCISWLAQSSGFGVERSCYEIRPLLRPQGKDL